MQSPSGRLQYLHERWFHRQATSAETEEMFGLLKEMDLNRDLPPLQETIWQGMTDNASFSDKHKEDLADRILKQYPAHPSGVLAPVRRLYFLRTAWSRYAAAFIILFGLGAYLWIQQKGKPELANASALQKKDVLPGSNKAILTLSNGRQVVLNAHTQETISDAGLAISNTNGALDYQGSSDVVVFNTMATPKGGQYKLFLPDGTAVWLNASSSIRYPTAFRESNRTVEITGEAYLEVAKNAIKPFIVKTNEELITVLGTSFNINAYPDEPGMKASLLEGSVRIGSTILRPGEAFAGGKAFITDVNQDVAWKNGVFNFQDKKLAEVMRQLSRWYDLEISYPKGMPAIEFWGKMGRDLNLSQVLKALEQPGLHFRLEAPRKLIVLP